MSTFGHTRWASLLNIMHSNSSLSNATPTVSRRSLTVCFAVESHWLYHFLTWYSETPISYSICLLLMLMWIIARVFLTSQALLIPTIKENAGGVRVCGKDVNTVPEAVPIWPPVQYISDTGQYQCTVSGLLLFYIIIIIIILILLEPIPSMFFRT